MWSSPHACAVLPVLLAGPNAAIYSSAAISDRVHSAVRDEGEIDMSTAQQAATVVALKQLGYKSR